ncbi:DUF418 domain-containing protein [Pseudonocardia sp. HH130629-09]|uniref:DUF418 domain-containing protein n=1 Tax=Pseudonocardia sp. HH130629-09 TaxID=1641402 RepID=UPI0006CB0836|nr:DUF418 domain-containing protein [Pseudonocardia sp. HH130629-09]ALE86616.1 hypothetical protein XF36_28850 [Pseudonocardia sp. HH130629-09]
MPNASSDDRIETLDVLRGIAIVGTLASNIWIFTINVGSAATPLLPDWIGEVSQWLPNGKFLGLLTIMFGIGLEIQRQSALRGGRTWPGTYPVRAGLLFLDGLINYVFVVQFDVLRAYAVTGLLVAFLLLTSDRVQWWLISVFFALHLTVLVLTSSLTVPPRGEALSLPELSRAARVPTEDGGYWSLVNSNLRNIGNAFTIYSEFSTILLMGIPLFLLGGKLYRAGIFRTEGVQLRRWLIVIGLVVALPVDFVLGTYDGGTLSSYSRYGTAPLVALGILAAVAQFYQHRAPGRFAHALGRVGTMALSCYLLQNVLGVVLERTIFQSNVVRTVDPVLGTYAVFAAISGILLAFAALWLRWRRRGPIEHLWVASFKLLVRERRADS